MTALLKWPRVLGVLMLCGLSLSARPFGAFDNGLNDVPELDAKAALLKQLGYDGIAWRPGRTAEMLAALDRHGLKMFATYVVLQASTNKCSIPTNVVSEINALKGRETIVWLGINGKSTDEMVVPAIQQIAQLAETNGLRVAIYPHTGFYSDTVTTSLRLAQATGRANVGVCFNLCHFLKLQPEAELAETLRAAGPRLFLVSLNGADSGDTRAMGWDRLIRPLGEGTFDLRRVLRLLDQIGYDGPVLLQCHQIKQPARRHLEASMQTWRTLQSPEPPDPK